MSNRSWNINEHKKCSICGNKTQFFVMDIFSIKTAHSETPVNRILERFMSKIPTNSYINRLQNSDDTYACQDCLIKIDEYDLSYTNAEKVENELINIILKSNEKKYKVEITRISFKHEAKKSDCKDELNTSEENERDEDYDDDDNNSNNDDGNNSNNGDEDSKFRSDETSFVAKCEMCNVKFNTLDELNEHEHDFKESDIIETSSDFKKNNNIGGHRTVELSGSLKVIDNKKCTICGQHFLSKFRYRKHMQEHKNSRPKCTLCNKDFANETLLEIHQAVHEGRSELECPFCSIVVSSRGAMVKHRRIHSQEYKYQCEKCGKQFLHDTSFKMHTYAHDDTRNVSCKICLRQFRCTPHLNRHMRIHTGEKPYSCSACGRLFAQRYNMMLHYKSHDPDNTNFKCTICETSFSSKKRLNEHLKTNHSIILETNINKADRLRRTPVFGEIKTT